MLMGVPTSTQIRTFVQLDAASIGYSVTAKPVLYGHSKIDKTTILMTNGSLMKVESILQYFWPALSDNRSWFDRLRKVLQYLIWFLK